MTTGSVGRGILVSDDGSETEREALAVELETIIRENRKQAWAPDCVADD